MKLTVAIDQFINGYFSTHDRSLKTLQAYTSDLQQFCRFLKRPGRDVNTLAPEDVEAWALALKRDTYQPASIRRKMASLRTFCNYWARRNVLTSSPFWRLRLNLGASRTLPRVLTSDEVAALLRCATREAAAYPARAQSVFGDAFFAQRNHAVVELLFATGLRVGELAAMQLEDLSLEDRSLIVHGKGRRERLAFLVEPRSFAVVSAYARARENVDADTSAFFINAERRPLSTQSIAALLHRLASSAGIKRRVTPHMLRHTIATLLLRNGVDLRIVQEFLGHASITMTQRYTHVAKEQLVRSLEQRHPRRMLKG